MIKLLKKAAEHPLIIGIIIALAPNISSGFRSWAWGIIKEAWCRLTDSYDVAGWIITVIGLYVLYSLFILAKIAYDKISTPPHFKYTTDLIYGLKWAWSWGGTDNNEIKNLRPYCQKCDAELIHAPAGVLHTAFRCNLCDKNLDPLMGNIRNIVREVKKEILRRLRTGEAY